MKAIENNQMFTEVSSEEAVSINGGYRSSAISKYIKLIAARPGFKPYFRPIFGGKIGGRKGKFNYLLGMTNLYRRS